MTSTAGPGAWPPALRRNELILLAAFVVLAVLLGVVARLGAPDEGLGDPRRSTYLTGPAGAKGLAETLVALGVTVERLRVPLFEVSADSEAARRGDVIALLDPPLELGDAERRELVDFVRRGGRLLLAGDGALPAFGIEARAVRHAEARGRAVRLDSLPLRAPAGIGALPPVHYTLAPVRPDTTRRPATERPPTLHASSVDTLLRTRDGRPVALLLSFERRGTGQVLELADAGLLSNEALKRTDAGMLVVSWLLALGSSRVVVDEYHQGFGRQWAIVGVTWGWLLGTPGGRAILQLLLAALVALTVAAVRFGPALSIERRRRRSPLEHVGALGAGLERAGGRDAAVELIVQGLRRRLARAGRPGGARGDLQPWLASLARAVDQPEARRAVTRLGWLLRERGREERVLEAAQTVEDVWQAMRRTKRSVS